MKQEKRGFLFKLPGHDRFDYKTRYYDPDKDEMDQKKNQIRFRDKGNQADTSRAQQVAGQFRKQREHSAVSRARGGQNQRTMLLAGMLLILIFSYMEKISLIFALPAVFLLLIYFIHKSKKV